MAHASEPEDIDVEALARRAQAWADKAAEAEASIGHASVDEGDASAYAAACRAEANALLDTMGAHLGLFPAGALVEATGGPHNPSAHDQPTVVEEEEDLPTNDDIPW